MRLSYAFLRELRTALLCSRESSISVLFLLHKSCPIALTPERPLASTTALLSFHTKRLGRAYVSSKQITYFLSYQPKCDQILRIFRDFANKNMPLDEYEFGNALTCPLLFCQGIVKKNSRNLRGRRYKIRQ